MRLVVDLNIAFRLLARQSGGILESFPLEPGVSFHVPRFFFVELFKHKERLVRAARLSEDAMLERIHALVMLLRFEDEAQISLGTWMEAWRLCGDVDEKDTPYVALALHLDASLWTRDEILKVRLCAKGFHRFYHR
jgi:predicted nucleic acid-binding protein